MTDTRVSIRQVFQPLFCSGWFPLCSRFDCIIILYTRTEKLMQAASPSLATSSARRAHVCVCVWGPCCCCGRWLLFCGSGSILFDNKGPPAPPLSFVMQCHPQAVNSSELAIWAIRTNEGIFPYHSVCVHARADSKENSYLSRARAVKVLNLCSRSERWGFVNIRDTHT